MLEDLSRSTKKLVIRSGIPLPRVVRAATQLLSFGQWVRASGLDDSPLFISRFQLYEHLHNNLIHNSAIDYLEFGVFTGESLLRWTKLNESCDSRFFGFDSFEGLPDDWNVATHTLPKGTFSTAGQLPE